MPALQPASHRSRPGAGAVTPTEGSARPAAVLLTTTFPARSGDGTPEFVLTLARSLRAFDVTVVAPRMEGSTPDEVVDGVRIRRFAYFPKRWEGLASDAIMPTLRAHPWRIVEVPCLIGALFLAARREVKRQKAVVINPHWIVPAGMVAVVVGWLCRVPYVVTIHGADAYTLRGRISGLVKRVVLGRAAAVLPVSGDIARTLELKADVPVLRMGVDTAVVRAAIGQRAPSPGLLVAIGRLADKKGIDVLLNALVDVPDARLEVVGDGPDRAALEAQAERLGLSDRVRFLGRQPRDGVIDALRRATAVVIPSVVGAGGDMEGTPVVLCEAMAAGVAVVASALGGLEECLVDGKTGLLVPPGDVESLAGALVRVVGGEVDLEAMGLAAEEEARRTLDINTIGGVYDQVMTDAAVAAGKVQAVAP
jgi:glycosyltransferase involved in cell wall biosynthesis